MGTLSGGRDVRGLVRSSLRSVRPRAGGLANAREAVRCDERSALQRRDAALEQARAEGTHSWRPLHRALVPARRGAGHAVHFAVNDADLVARLTSFVAEGMARDEVCVVIATAGHRAGLRESLAVHGLRHGAADLLVELDANELLPQLVPEASLDRDAFDRLIAGVVRRSGPPHAGLRAFGEIVGLLHDRGHLSAALQLESRWDEVQRRLGFPLLCAYLNTTQSQDSAEFVGQVCASHTHLAGAST